MNNNGYCVVSKELLIFLEWLINNEVEINKIVSYSWDKGLSSYISKKSMMEFNSEQMQEVIFEFFSIVESSIKNIEKMEKKKIINFDNFKKETSADKLDIHSYSSDVLPRIFSTLIPLIKESGMNKSAIKNIFYKQFLEEWDFTDALCH